MIYFISTKIPQFIQYCMFKILNKVKEIHFRIIIFGFNYTSLYVCSINNL